MTTISLAPVNILHIIYLTMAVFSILLVFGKKPYKALALLLAAHAVQEVFNILEELNITRQYYLITPAIQLAIGPLYYLFVKNLIYGNLVIRNHLFHLVPMVIGFGFTAWWPILLNVAFVVLLVYIYLTFGLLRHYYRVLVEVIADDESHALRWLSRTFIIIGMIELVDFVRQSTQLEQNYELWSRWYFLSELLSLLITTYLVVKAIRQPKLYSGFKKFEEIVNTDRSLASGTEDELAQAQSIFSSICTHLTNTCGYRQPKYSLRQLAAEMGLSEQMTSWAINQGGKVSFSDYINSLRLEQVKPCLRNKQGNQSIIDIAFDAGFSSKSSFNAVFKRNTGMTPSQYLKQN